MGFYQIGIPVITPNAVIMIQMCGRSGIVTPQIFRPCRRTELLEVEVLTGDSIRKDLPP